MRRGVLCALRARAAVEEALRAGLEGWWAKRSGLGVKVDLMPRARGGVVVVAALCGKRDLEADGRRYEGGVGPQLRGILGGIVVCGFAVSECS